METSQGVKPSIVLAFLLFILPMRNGNTVIVQEGLWSAQLFILPIRNGNRNFQTFPHRFSIPFYPTYKERKHYNFIVPNNLTSPFYPTYEEWKRCNGTLSPIVFINFLSYL